jgi:hypothetical protein
MEWKQLLAYMTGSVDQELLVRNEYLVTENRILRQQITGRVRLSDGERKTLAELGKRLGKKALQEVASIVTPDTILAWHRKLIANKYDAHYHQERPHQGKGNLVLMPAPAAGIQRAGSIQCRERLGGLLKYYHREAA